MLQASPLPWDGLTFELWTPLLNGGRVVLHSGEPLTPTVLRRARERGVNTMFLTGSLLGSLVQDDAPALGGFRQLVTGGERTSVHAVREFLRAHPGGRLLHVYGPAEITMYATAARLTLAEVAGLDDVPLGPALPATTVTVRDEHRRVLPAGEVGEIYVGGEGVAIGYVGDPDLTAARFVRADGERLYRTGDLGWLDERGRLRFVGRKDRQVKLRGNRLELAEVEAAMRREPTVLEAHVVVQTLSSGVARLVGHYTTTDGKERSAAVRAGCALGLPAYAVPELRHHPRLPTNVNGKVDLRALADLAPESAPLDGDPVRRRLQLLVSEVRDRIPDVAEDLAERGMDSLTAMRVAYRVSREFQVDFEVTDLYAARSLAGVAERLPTLPALSPDEPDSDLTPAQHDWWLREQLQPGDPGALVASVFRITGDAVSETALAAAVQDLADRHDLLRSHFEYGQDGPRLTLLPPGGVCPLRIDDEPVDLAAGLPASWLSPFDLESAPTWRVCLGRDAAGTTVVGLVLHHWLVDGWSESLLVAEFGAAWRSRERGRAPEWSGPAAGSDGRGLSRRRPEPLAEARRFWAELLAGTEQFPVAPPSGAPAGPRVGRWSSRFARRDPAELPAAEDVQAAILSAWGAALAAMGHRGRYPVGVAYAARDRVSEYALGCHVELLPLPIAARPDAGRAAADIGDVWRTALRHGSLPLSEMLVGVSRDRHRQALKAVFVFQSNRRAELDLGPERRTERVEPPTVAPLHQLALEAFPAAGATFTLRLEWDRRTVDDTWAEAMRKHLLDALPGAGLLGSAE